MFISDDHVLDLLQFAPIAHWSAIPMLDGHPEHVAGLLSEGRANGLDVDLVKVVDVYRLCTQPFDLQRRHLLRQAVACRERADVQRIGWQRCRVERRQRHRRGIDPMDPDATVGEPVVQCAGPGLPGVPATRPHLAVGHA
ncbi:MAG: hypothetical protein J0L57_00400 [Burkholderiales bacterium]|nr:hypothetical protein [Burkholderiales bacterium]